MAEARLVVQLALGAIFLLSTAAKLRDPVSFVRGVADYKVLPPSLSNSFASLLIPLEAFLSVSHFTGWLLELAVPLGLGMLMTFALAVRLNLQRGRALPCYCFSGTGETISRRALARLLLLMGGEALLLADPALFVTSRLVYPRQIASLPELGLALLWAALLVVAGLWLLSLDEMVELLRSCGVCRRSRPIVSTLEDR